MSEHAATGIAEEFSGEDGFTLIEMVCVLAVIALLAAIALARLPSGTTRQQLEAYTIEVVTLLKSDRLAAIRERRQVTTEIDARARSLRAGANGRLVRLPEDVVFDALLPDRCNQRPTFSSISFFASGMSCGGTVALTRFGVGYEIRVNWLTGGVDVVPYGTSQH
jgi:general secretion pathway protein H